MHLKFGKKKFCNLNVFLGLEVASWALLPDTHMAFKANKRWGMA